MCSLRIGGLASGMDTELMIKNLMQVQRLPLQRLEQNKQIWQWKQEDYRSLNMSLLALRNKAFDMKLESPYLAKRIMNSNENVLEVTAGAGANSATYNILVSKLASSANTYSKVAVSQDVKLKDSIYSWLNDESIKAGDTFSFYLRDRDDGVGAISDFQLNAQSIQGVKATGSAKIGVDDGIFTIKANDNGNLLNNYKIQFITDENLGNLSVNIDNAEKTIKVRANFADQNLKLDDIADALNQKMDATGLGKVSFNLPGKAKVADLADTKITFKGGVNEVRGEYEFAISNAFAAGEYLTINGQSFKGVVGKADATKGEFSVDGDQNDQMASIMKAINENKVLKDRFEPATIVNGKIALIESENKATGRDITNPVNGIGFDFSYGDSLEKVISTVNGNKFAGVSMFFDEGTKKLVLTSRATGAEQEINIYDNVGSLMTGVMKIDTTDKSEGSAHYKKGTNAEFNLNGLNMERSANNFQINGVSFYLKAEGNAKLEVQNDVDQVVKNIKDFIDLYNKTINEVYGKINEESFRKFPPLTVEQKAEMSEKEIEAWEEKAKSGLLQRDSLLSGAMNSLRRAMTSTVKGTDLENIFALGMKTGSYSENGKIYIDEDKLREAVEKDPEAVMKLFTGDVEGGQGIARRMQDELDHAIKQVTAKAGSAGTIYDQSTISEAVRELDKQMFRLEERLAQAEERYWKQFVAMEQALQTMYSQGDWLAQQMMAMGGGK